MIFINENNFVNVICKVAAILSRPECVKQQHGNDINDLKWLMIL